MISLSTRFVLFSQIQNCNKFCVWSADSLIHIHEIKA